MILIVFLAMLGIIIMQALQFYRKIKLFKKRLENKDRIIAYLIRALPILFVENFKDPNPMKERDGSFVFHVQTRPEYDGRFITIKWICEGVEKEKYNSLIMRYFFYLESLGLKVHPTLLGDRPYSGRVMLESYHELDEDETQTMEESEQSVRQT